MAKIQIPQVDEVWITRQLDDEIIRDRVAEEFKFVLAQGPNNLGYVRFESLGFQHSDILDMLHTEIAKAGGNYKDYLNRGGGFVIIPGLEEMISAYRGDFEKRQPSQYTLEFYGDSHSLGGFDAKLLEKTLREGLSPRFILEIG